MSSKKRSEEIKLVIGELFRNNTISARNNNGHACPKEYADTFLL